MAEFWQPGCPNMQCMLLGYAAPTEHLHVQRQLQRSLIIHVHRLLQQSWINVNGDKYATATAALWCQQD
jgi:hypothetical protein